MGGSSQLLLPETTLDAFSHVVPLTELQQHVHVCIFCLQRGVVWCRGTDAIGGHRYSVPFAIRLQAIAIWFVFDRKCPGSELQRFVCSSRTRWSTANQYWLNKARQLRSSVEHFQQSVNNFFKLISKQDAWAPASCPPTRSCGR